LASCNPTKLFETDTSHLRPFHPTNLEFLLELESDEEVMKTTGIGRALEPERIEERLQKLLAAKPEALGVFAAASPQTDEPLAWVMLRPTSFCHPELCFMLPKRLWGQGIATRAALAALRYGFDSLRLKHIYATTSRTNDASMRVLAKCGFLPDETHNGELNVHVTTRPNASADSSSGTSGSEPTI
jgi:ribosomal-protein-alanine N-acetyltransferase